MNASSSSVRLILASASPRRAHLLTQMGLPHLVRPADVEEWEDGHGDPPAMVLHNACLKGEYVASRNPGTWTLAADTTVALDGRVLAKPADMDEARAMLCHLSARAHEVFTGTVLIGPDGQKCQEAVRSVVHFRELDDATIDHYFSIVNPLDKAGAYGIQDGRELIIDRWEGSLSNVMGLSVEWLEKALRDLGAWEQLRASDVEPVG